MQDLFHVVAVKGVEEGFKYFVLDEDGQGYIKRSFKFCGSSTDVFRMTSSRGE
jgi:hypothetical protein